jgi:hypothetical protein
MPDTRATHTHYSRAAHSLYGDKGPMQAMGHFSPRPMSTTISPRRMGLGPAPPPETVQEHVAAAIEKIPDLSRRQKNSVHAAMLSLCRDIGFIRAVHGQVGWSQHPPQQDEGRLL